MELLDGTALSAKILDGIRSEVSLLRERAGAVPVLATVIVGKDPASLVYVRKKVEACARVGMGSRHEPLPPSAAAGEVEAVLAGLNADPSVSGVLLQMPLPKGLPADRLQDVILPEKDVDGFHPANMGLLALGRPRFVPCTPAGVMALLDAYGVSAAGRRATVVGRSGVVGKPLAMLLLQRDATVLVAHSKTADLRGACLEADILVAAAGRPGVITASHVKEGAVVIDVGINSVSDESEVLRILGPGSPRLDAFRKKGSALVGDVEWASVSAKASALTPVPGGVGPLTIAMLMRNTLQAFRLQKGIEP